METCKQHGTHMAFPFGILNTMSACKSLHLVQQAVGPAVSTYSPILALDDETQWRILRSGVQECDGEHLTPRLLYIN